MMKGARKFICPKCKMPIYVNVQSGNFLSPVLSSIIEMLADLDAPELEAAWKCVRATLVDRLCEQLRRHGIAEEQVAGCRSDLMAHPPASVHPPKDADGSVNNGSTS